MIVCTTLTDVSPFLLNQREEKEPCDKPYIRIKPRVTESSNTNTNITGVESG